MNRNQKLLEIAAEKTFERIHEDHEKAPARIKPLLAYLEEHLFEPQLDFNQLKKACNIRDNTIPIQFHTSVGLPPYAYIEDCRLETACRLLRDTDLKVWQITQLLGYSSIQVFSRAFGRWSGMRPTAYRKKERKKMGTTPAPKIADVFTESDRPIRVETLRKGLQGHLDDDEVFGVVMHLLRVYPETKERLRNELGGGMPTESAAAAKGSFSIADGTFDPIAGVDPDEDDRVGRIQAEELWNELANRNLDEQRRLLEDGVRLKSPALFHLLRQKSREEGRNDRGRGIEIAELALASLGAIPKSVLTDKQRATLEAQGLAWLSNAHRLKGDLPQAEELMRDAEDRLPARPGRLPRLDLLQARAALDWSQRQYDEAQSVQKKVVALARKADDDSLLAQALILEGQILRRLGETEAAMESLQEALDRLEDGGDEYLQLSGNYALAECCVEAGDAEAAEELLPSIQELAKRSDQRELGLLAKALEGIVARGSDRLDDAEDALKEAVEGFRDGADSGRAAIISLDLAAVHAAQNRPDDVAEVVAGVLPVLDSLKLRPEAMASVRLLQDAVAQKSLSAELVESVRTALSERAAASS